MKTVLMTGIALLTMTLAQAGAQASTFTCTTNVDRNPMHGATIVTIAGHGDNADATISTNGGMAHFITAGVTFPVQVQSYGPEIVQFSSNSGFTLEVDFQPIAGEVTGELSYGGFPVLDQAPVVCTLNQR